MGLIENRATHKLMYDHDIDHWKCEGVPESRFEEAIPSRQPWINKPQFINRSK